MFHTIQEQGDTMIITNNCISNQSFTELQQNASRTIAEQQQTIIQQSHTTMLFLAILISIFILTAFLIGYFLIRNKFAYKLMFLKHGKLESYWKWNISDKIHFKHSKNDEFDYIVDATKIHGNILIWRYRQPEQIAITEQEITTAQLNYATLNKSTVLEKIITAEDFMGLIKTLIIIIIALVIIDIVINGIILKKPLTCYTILNNQTIAMTIDNIQQPIQ